MKKHFLSIIAALVPLCAVADDGMWLPNLISARIADMQAKGFRLSAEDIYSVNQASLKDAVVLFGRGCTGELISSEGLLITNHHCGYGQIQSHSSVEHDYLRDGFWAMTRAEELPCPGLSVSFLERMDDVSSQVLRGYEAGMDERQRDSVVRANSARLIEEATADGKGLRASVEAMYYGNIYYIFIYREYTDIRLVGAPPSSIGKFGGDTDNWMWPRHTGDFSMFRVYAGEDNMPAGYSPENRPYSPKRFFSISTKGVQEGDFTFIYGFPGSTREYIHSSEVEYISEVSDPARIDIRTRRLEIQKRHMAASQKVRIQYSAKCASVANAWKKWQGEVKGVRKMNTVQKKREYERDFERWAAGSHYEGVTERIAALERELRPYAFARDIYSET
ncbi:MAG: S46 family peptidase, partial [Bacteroidales bacterium]|nr:S46 family peptidase [Bacteroidales bacterium]